MGEEYSFTKEQEDTFENQREEAILNIIINSKKHPEFPKKYFVVSDDYQFHALGDNGAFKETFFMTTAMFEKENWDALKKTGKTFAQNSIDMILRNEEEDIAIIPLNRNIEAYLSGCFLKIEEGAGYRICEAGDKGQRRIYATKVPESRFEKIIGNLKNSFKRVLIYKK